MLTVPDHSTSEEVQAISLPTLDALSMPLSALLFKLAPGYSFNNKPALVWSRFRPLKAPASRPQRNVARTVFAVLAALAAAAAAAFAAQRVAPRMLLNSPAQQHAAVQTWTEGLRWDAWEAVREHKEAEKAAQDAAQGRHERMLTARVRLAQREANFKTELSVADKVRQRLEGQLHLVPDLASQPKPVVYRVRAAAGALYQRNCSCARHA